jgi:hypothetical protein
MSTGVAAEIRASIASTGQLGIVDRPRCHFHQ